MTKATIYTQDGRKNGEVQLPDNLFAIPWSDPLMHQVVTGIANNERAGTAHTKGRSEVRGGGRKPWRQKGTGRARHGSVRSPLWVGGGVTFGPSREKKYAVRINRKMRTKALFTALSEKAGRDALVFLESFSVDAPSTKTAAACVASLCGDAVRKKNVCTVVFPENDPVARKSFANIPGVTVSALAALNAKDAVAARQLVFVNPAKTMETLAERGKNLTVAAPASATASAQPFATAGTPPAQKSAPTGATAAKPDTATSRTATASAQPSATAGALKSADKSTVTPTDRTHGTPTDTTGV